MGLVPLLEGSPKLGKMPRITSKTLIYTWPSRSSLPKANLLYNCIYV